MKITDIIPILLLGSSFHLLAQGLPPGPPDGPPPDPVVAALDKNHDQKLSASEIKNAAKALLKLDKDHDKSLSAEELKPEPPRGERRRKQKDDGGGKPAPPQSAITQAIDTDGDGELSTEELRKASNSLKTLDTDGDGKVSSEEGEIQKPHRGGPPGGGQGGGQGGQGGGQGGEGPPPGGPPGGGPPPGGRGR